MPEQPTGSSGPAEPVRTVQIVCPYSCITATTPASACNCNCKGRGHGMKHHDLEGLHLSLVADLRNLAKAGVHPEVGRNLAYGMFMILRYGDPAAFWVDLIPIVGGYARPNLAGFDALHVLAEARLLLVHASEFHRMYGDLA